MTIENEAWIYEEKEKKYFSYCHSCRYFLAGVTAVKQMGRKAMSDNQIPVSTAVVKKGNINTELKASGTLPQKTHIR